MTEVTPATPVRPAGRVVFWTQLTLLCAYVLGSFGILILAAIHVGDAGAILDPGLDRLGDPKDALPGIGPGTMWNPLVWIFGICRLIAWFVYPIGIAMLLFGTATLAHAARRGDRRTVTRVAVLTALWLILVIVAATPYGAL